MERVLRNVPWKRDDRAGCDRLGAAPPSRGERAAGLASLNGDAWFAPRYSRIDEGDSERIRLEIPARAGCNLRAGQRYQQWRDAQAIMFDHP